jgi:hypothetical protein
VDARIYWIFSFETETDRAVAISSCTELGTSAELFPHADVVFSRFPPGAISRGQRSRRFEAE